jgi:hypothetical protein
MFEFAYNELIIKVRKREYLLPNIIIIEISFLIEIINAWLPVGANNCPLTPALA